MTTNERDYAAYATAKTSPTMEAFGEFLIAKVYGGTLPKGLDRASFLKGVALGGSTRGYFQASEEWKTDPRNYLANVDARRAERETAKLEAARKAREKNDARIAKAEAALAELRAKVAPVATDESETDRAMEASASEAEGNAA